MLHPSDVDTAWRPRHQAVEAFVSAQFPFKSCKLILLTLRMKVLASALRSCALACFQVAVAAARVWRVLVPVDGAAGSTRMGSQPWWVFPCSQSHLLRRVLCIMLLPPSRDLQGAAPNGEVRLP